MADALKWLLVQRHPNLRKKQRLRVGTISEGALGDDQTSNLNNNLKIIILTDTQHKQFTFFPPNNSLLGCFAFLQITGFRWGQGFRTYSMKTQTH